MTKQFVIFLLFVTFSSYTQSVYKDVAKISDSTDYYLEIGLFNKEDKKSYKRAIEFTEKAITYAKSNNLNDKLADSYLQLGNIYYDLEKNNLAIDYFIRAVNTFDTKEPKTNLALSYYGLGKCYLKKDNIKVAEIYFEKAASLYEKLNFFEAIELINLQKGIIKKEKKDYPEATTILLSVIKNLDDDAFLSTKSEAYFQLGEIEMAQKKYAKAISYYDLANVANQTNKSDFEASKKILKQLSIAYERSHNKEKSYFYLKKLV